MLVAYGRIAHTLWFHATPGEVTLTGLDAVGACKRLDERKRVVRMLFVIVSVFAVSWFPFFSLQVNRRESSALHCRRPAAKDDGKRSRNKRTHQEMR